MKSRLFALKTIYRLGVLLSLFLIACNGDRPEEGHKSSQTSKSVVKPDDKKEIAHEDVVPDSDIVKDTDKVTIKNVMDGYDLLTDKQYKSFWGSLEDEPSVVLDAQKDKFVGRHFLYSDEKNPQVYYKSLKDLGGAYVGVGTDQGYLFLGWMKANAAWLTDYDQWVVLLHQAYFAFFKEAKTPDDFYRFWYESNEKSSIEFLKQVYKDDKNQKLIVKVYRHGRFHVAKRLGQLRSKLNKHKIPGFISDQEQYDFVRNLILANRVRPMLGNLLEAKGLQGVANVSKELNVPVRAFYVSNAESYWPFTDQYKANVQSMNFDESSLVMRTFASKPNNGDYCYSTQSALNFKEWLKEPGVTRITDVWQRDRFVRKESEIPFSHINEPPSLLEKKN